MTINFYKYQGTGNDFVLVDNRSQEIHPNQKLDIVKKMCERRFGIGSDGMIFIENSIDSDFYMDFYNPDGSQSFCGNGSRCAVAFAYSLGMIEKICSFHAFDGEHYAQIGENNIVKVKMKDSSEITTHQEDYFIHTGSPHYVSFKTNKNIIEFGREIRYSDFFAKNGGTNVNLVKEENVKAIQIQTYERGVENETFSCGTGATACALIFAHKNKFEKGVIDVKVKGGDLKVSFEKSAQIYTNIWLEGPAKYVFKGEITI